MLFENNKNEKKQRFYAQAEKARSLLNVSALFNYIDGLKYCYSFSIRYSSVNLKNIINSNVNDINKPNFDKCLKAGILKPWNDTYWFDKEKAESLQQYILEHSN